MQISAKELGLLLNGIVEGDATVEVSGPSKIEEGKEGTISFLSNPKYEKFAYTTKSSILLVSKGFKPEKPLNSTLIRVENVYASVAQLLDKFGEDIPRITGISKEAFIHEEAKIGKGVSVGRFSIIEKGTKIGRGSTIYPQVFVDEKVEIGENVTLYPGVKIYHACKIGDNCILHANVVIGSDGFGFAPETGGTYKKIPQLGNVILEDNVEIGANTVIDRATMGSTIVREGAKLDNLIQVAHNVEIGASTVIAAQAGVAGSTKIGKNAMIGGQAGIVGHVEIADGTKVQAQSGINKSIKKTDTSFYGSPALEYNNYLRSYAVFRRLPELQQKIHQLEKQLAELLKDSDK
jgi:UDP-3-O-[3-hydroxymyristoyl] glucosamine N-acyltransferase